MKSYFSKLVVISLLISVNQCKLLDEPEKFYEDTLFNCLSVVVSTFLNNSVNLLITNLRTVSIRWVPLIQTENLRNYVQYSSVVQNSMQLYILEVNSTIFAETLQHICTAGILNPSATFVLVTQHPVILDIDVFKNGFASNIFLIERGVDVFHYSIYNDQHKKKFANKGLCVDFDRILQKIMHSNLNDWSNTTVKALLRIAQPYVTGRGDGLEERLLQVLHKLLKFRLIVDYLEPGVSIILGNFKH